MKTMTYAKAAATFIAICLLAGCGGKSEGDQFIGVWKNGKNLKKTLTVSKVDDQFKLVEVFDAQNGPALEAHVVAKSTHILGKSGSDNAILVLSDNGKNLSSYMRAVTDDTYTKVAECITADCKVIKPI